MITVTVPVPLPLAAGPGAGAVPRHSDREPPEWPASGLTRKKPEFSLGHVLGPYSVV